MIIKIMKNQIFKKLQITIKITMLNLFLSKKIYYYHNRSRMLVKKAIWEKRNLGLDVYEILVEVSDTAYDIHQLNDSLDCNWRFKNTRRSY